MGRKKNRIIIFLDLSYYIMIPGKKSLNVSPY